MEEIPSVESCSATDPGRFLSRPQQPPYPTPSLFLKIHTDLRNMHNHCSLARPISSNPAMAPIDDVKAGRNGVGTLEIHGMFIR
jgi:hypothetical protein